MDWDALKKKAEAVESSRPPGAYRGLPQTEYRLGMSTESAPLPSKRVLQSIYNDAVRTARTWTWAGIVLNGSLALMNIVFLMTVGSSLNAFAAIFSGGIAWYFYRRLRTAEFLQYKEEDDV